MAIERAIDGRASVCTDAGAIRLDFISDVEAVNIH